MPAGKISLTALRGIMVIGSPGTFSLSETAAEGATDDEQVQHASLSTFALSTAEQRSSKALC